MSGRFLSRYVLAGFLIAALAAPVAAQEGRSQPDVNELFRPDGRATLPPPPRLLMPAPQAPGAVRPVTSATQDLLRSVCGYNFEVLLRILAESATVAPMPREKAVDHKQLLSNFTAGSFVFETPLTMPQPVPPMSAPLPPLVDVQFAAPAWPPCCQGTTGGILGSTYTRDPANIFRPVQIKLIDGSGCGTFQHATGPQPVQFLTTVMQPMPPGRTFIKLPAGSCYGEFIEIPAPSPAPVARSPRDFFMMDLNGGVLPVGGVTVSPVTSVTVTTHPANPLIGTWYRDVAMAIVGVTFTHDEMKLNIAMREGTIDDKPFTITITAHYTLTKDGLVYGAITGADAESKSGFDKDDTEVLAFVQGLADRPFSFRVKHTSAGMMVSALKVSLPECGREEEKELQLFGGMYKLAKDGKVPTPVPVKVNRVGKCDSGFNPVDYPIPGPVNPYIQMPVPSQPRVIITPGIEFSMPVPSQPLPPGMRLPAPPFVQPSGPAMLPRPPLPLPKDYGTVADPLGVPVGGFSLPPAPMYPVPVKPQPAPPLGLTTDSMKQMAGAVFGQMLQQGGVLPPPPPLPPLKSEPLPQYRNAVDPCYPERYDIARQPVVAPFAIQQHNGTAKPAGITGTWYREIGPMMCVIKIEADHITVTAYMAATIDKKEVKEGAIITADYHQTRDGTVVGLITGMDLLLEGDIPDDANAEVLKLFAADDWTKMQKGFVGQPFAFTARVYGDALMISNVRAPKLKDDELAGCLAGRYKNAGDKPLPKSKPVKTDSKSSSSGMTLPSPRYLEHYPQYFAPDLTFPLPRELASQEDPEGAVRRAGGSAPTMIPPAAPSEDPPMMPQPTPPQTSNAPKPVAVTEMAIAYRSKVITIPDPTREGKTTPGIAGQMFLYGGTKLESVPAIGTLTIDLTDETPRPAGQAAATPERWQFDKAALRLLRIDRKASDESYVLFLPWPAYKPDITKVKITARYDSENGAPFVLPTVSLTISPEKEETPTMPEPVKPELKLKGSAAQPFLVPQPGSVPRELDKVTLPSEPTMPEPMKPVLPMTPPVQPDVRIQVPALGPLPLALDFAVPLDRAPAERKQLFNFPIGLFENK